MARRLGFGASLLLAVLAARASSAAPRAKDAERKPPVPLHTAIADRGPEVPWELTVKNASNVPVRVQDDPRLVWLEVVRPGDEKATSCRLPEDARPPRDGTRHRVLGPGEALTHRIDPRFFCFEERLRKALAPSAQVTAHYGYPSKTRTRWKGGKKVEEKLPDEPPWVAVPEGEGPFGPARNASGDFVVLDERYAAWAVPEVESGDEDDEPKEPELEVVRGSDARTETHTTATVRIRNPTAERVTIFVRRELLTFEVHTPEGVVDCDAEPDARSPDHRRAFASVAPGGALTMTSRLVELCPRGTFADRGLYLVTARLDAPVDGADVGIEAFTGRLRSARAVPLRVRRDTELVPIRRAGGPTAGGPGTPPPPAAAPPPPPPPPPPAQ